MDTYNVLLKKIREMPGLWLGEKSLKRLTSHMQGYELGVTIGKWEESTGLNFFEHFDETTRLGNISSSDYFFTFEFNKFVHLHYGQIMQSLSGASLISQNSNSEEEAFDKYFELLDEFLKQRGAPKE